MFVRASVLSKFGLGEMFGFCSGAVFQNSSGNVTANLADVHFAIGSDELVNARLCVMLWP
jgi:hypothetical protein